MFLASGDARALMHTRGPVTGTGYDRGVALMDYRQVAEQSGLPCVLVDDDGVRPMRAGTSGRLLSAYAD